MDYMKQEQERGITIQSAAITFPWKEYRCAIAIPLCLPLAFYPLYNIHLNYRSFTFHVCRLIN
jgi:hypothetical protein